MISAISSAMVANSMASNAQYNAMQGRSSMLNLMNSNLSPAQAFRYEKALTNNILMNDFKAKAYEAMEKSNKKLAKENIKRSFSTFA